MDSDIGTTICDEASQGNFRPITTSVSCSANLFLKTYDSRMVDSLFFEIQTHFQDFLSSQTPEMSRPGLFTSSFQPICRDEHAPSSSWLQRYH